MNTTPQPTDRPDIAPIAGLHHVTAIARDPQANVDFYAGVLGLRLVKKTVNFDDPGTYHLYYGDADGNPGSIMTFFPWPGARRGQIGAGQATATSFAVPSASLDFWRDRLAGHDIVATQDERFGTSLLTFVDPDGLRLELVATVEADDPRPPWAAGIPAEVGIRGFDGVTLTETDETATIALLTDVMGFRRVGEEGRRTRFESGEGGSGTRVDLLLDSGAPRGRGGAGTVHHIAFRNADDPDQLAWRRRLTESLQWPTDVRDRQYFHSIYFREPGGVLFEMATDPPGFAVDESADRLGSELRLPPWFEARRAEIEAALPTINSPTSTTSPGDAS